MFLALTLKVEASFFTVDLQLINESVESLNDKNNFLYDKQKQMDTKLKGMFEELQAIDPNNKAEIEEKMIQIQRLRQSFEEDLSRTAKLIQEQKRTIIEDSAKDLLGDWNILMDKSLVLAGGKDITKDMIQALKGSSPNKTNDKLADVKIGVIDMASLMSHDSIKDKKKFINVKISEFQKKQEELSNRIKNEGLDQKEAELELYQMRQEINSANEMVYQQIARSVSKASKTVAYKNSYDLIVFKELISHGGNKIVTDVTADILKFYDSEDNVDKMPKSKVGSIILDDVIEKAPKFVDMRKALEKKAGEMEKELKDKYNEIQEMRDKNRSKEEIEKAEMSFARERELRTNLFNTERSKFLDKIMHEVKYYAGKIMPSSGKVVILTNSNVNSGLAFAGEDMTSKVLDAINKK
jgi:hypothetical protein